MKKRNKKKRILSILCVVCLLAMAFPARAAEQYGTVTESGGKADVRIDHEALADKMVALLFYNEEGSVDQMEERYIGYIDQGTADETGKLEFSGIPLPQPETGSVTYGVYIGAEGIERMKLDEITLTAGSPEGKPGDMNGDGTITAVDALLALRAVNAGPTDEQFQAGNVNGDDSLDVNDVLLILKAAAGEPILQ